VTGEIYEPPMAANVISGLKLFLILSQPWRSNVEKIFPFFSWPQRGQLITLISPIVTHSLNRSLTHSNRYLLSRIVLQVIWQK
jgi:hypothetical protein